MQFSVNNTFCTILVATTLLGPAAYGQALSDADRARLGNEINREQTDQTREEERRIERLRKSRKRSSQSPSIVDPLQLQPGGPCFNIKEVKVSGHEVFGKVPSGFTQLKGSCATAANISEALNQINIYYQKQGFITTRAYAPEQDIADGTVEITIVPGRVEGFVYANGNPADLRITSAFPVKRGELLNLRDLEQGLDNINAPRSATAKFQLIPGEKLGGSFVQVGIVDGRRWHLDAEVNNSGYDTTGEVKGNVSFGYDNLIGLNDRLNFGIGSTPFDSRDDNFSDSYWVDWSSSIGKWSFGFDAGASGYYFILPGINQSYPVEGRSHYGGFFAERLLFRDQQSRLYATGALKLSRTRTFIDNQEIESQRRRLSIGSVGVRGDTGFKTGKLEWDLGLRFGLDVFDSYVLEKSIVDPEFRLLKLNAKYELPLGNSGVTYKAKFSGQYSDDILPGTEQFSVGGWSTVRGFHEDSMYGDSGFYLQNTLDWKFKEEEHYKINFNVGLDAGYVQPSKLRFWSQDYLVGASAGTDIKIGKSSTLSLGAAYALSRPDKTVPNSQPDFEDGRFVGYASYKIKF